MVYTSFLTFYFRFSAGQSKFITRTFCINKTTNPLSQLLIIKYKAFISFCQILFVKSFGFFKGFVNPFRIL